jgi:hypothetical protein
MRELIIHSLTHTVHLRRLREGLNSADSVTCQFCQLPSDPQTTIRPSHLYSRSYPSRISSSATLSSACVCTKRAWQNASPFWRVHSKLYSRYEMPFEVDSLSVACLVRSWCAENGRKCYSTLEGIQTIYGNHEAASRTCSTIWCRQ